MSRVEVAVDVGNSRIKWGRCDRSQVIEVAALPDAAASWAEQAGAWRLAPGGCRWLLASVHPARAERFAAWALDRGDTLQRIERPLPLPVQVDFPERVGIDRLLNALGARQWMPAGRAAVIVDAGTAMTVDAVAADGTFHGGCICPGVRLLAGALHQHTAQLPLVDRLDPPTRVPGRHTEEAIRGGVLHMLLGAVERIHRLIAAQDAFARPVGLVTGGDAELIVRHLGPEWRAVPTLTLEGIRRSGGTEELATP